MYLNKNMLKNKEKQLHFLLEHICVAEKTTFKEVAIDIPLLNFICIDGIPYGNASREIFQKYSSHKEQLDKLIDENWAVVEPPCLLLTKGQDQRKIIHMVIDVEERKEDTFSILEKNLIEGFKLLAEWTNIIKEYVFFVQKLDVDWWYAAMEVINTYIHSYCIENDVNIIIIINE